MADPLKSDGDKEVTRPHLGIYLKQAYKERQEKNESKRPRKWDPMDCDSEGKFHTTELELLRAEEKIEANLLAQFGAQTPNRTASAKRSRLHGKDEKQSLEEVVKGAGRRCAEVKTDDSESLIVLTPAHRSSKFWW